MWVGLYLNPPDRALVLCVDEKSQIQALHRTAPILPLRPRSPERQTHDYRRHGTTTLFAAFNILNGKVIGHCLPRHRGREFVKFLRELEGAVPPDLDIHLIVDNYSTHKSAAVHRWLRPKKRRRFQFISPAPVLLAQPGGALVRTDYRAHDSSRDLSNCCRTGACHGPGCMRLCFRFRDPERYSQEQRHAGSRWRGHKRHFQESI